MWTIERFIACQGRKFGNKEAVVQGETRLSFADLDHEAGRAAALLQSLGIAKGDRVALMGRNSIAWVVAMLGAVRAGAVVVPLNHKLAPPEVAYILEHSEPRLLLLDGHLATALDAVHPSIPRLVLDGAADGLDALMAGLDGAPAFSPVLLSPDDPAEILYTSGTTGKPKGCLHSHATVLLAASSSNQVYALSPADRTLIAMPIWHAYPLNNLLIGSLVVGATAVLLAEYHPVEFLKIIAAERCSVVFGAPIAYVMPLKMADPASFDLSSVRVWIYGAGPIDAKTLERLRAQYRSGGFCQVYGMTETGPSGMALLPPEHEDKAGSIGRFAASGVDVKVMKTPVLEAGPGEVGEIWMQSQSMMLGYYRDDEATAAAFREGWYLTGDLARLDADGYLTIVDRSRDKIVTGGENVYSKEVEDVLAAFPGIIEAAVVGKADPEWGETVIALIVAPGGIDQDGLRRHCEERLARYKIPREFRIMAEMPRTPTGKIMKYVLKARLAEE